MADAARRQYPEIYEDLAAALLAALVKAGVSRAAARAGAEKAVEHVRYLYGGQYVYFPIGLGYKIAQRNAEIRRRLQAGESRAAIRNDYQLSEQRLKQIEADDTLSRG